MGFLKILFSFFSFLSDTFMFINVYYLEVFKNVIGLNFLIFNYGSYSSLCLYVLLEYDQIIIIKSDINRPDLYGSIQVGTVP